MAFNCMKNRTCIFEIIQSGSINIFYPDSKELLFLFFNQRKPKIAIDLVILSKYPFISIKLDSLIHTMAETEAQREHIEN